MTTSDVSTFLDRLADRVPPDLLVDAREYVGQDEWSLALELVANSLFENDEHLAVAELAYFDQIANSIDEPADKYCFLRQP